MHEGDRLEACGFGYAFVFTLGQVFPGGEWWGSNPGLTVLFFAMQIVTYAIACAVFKKFNSLSKRLYSFFDWICAFVILGFAAIECMGFDMLSVMCLRQIWAAILGVSMAWLRLRWFGYWGSLSARNAVIYLFGGLAAGSLISALVILLPYPIGRVLVAVMPVASVLANHLAIKTLPVRNRSSVPNASDPLFLKYRIVFVFVCACSVMAGVNNVGDLTPEAMGGSGAFASAYIVTAVSAAVVGYSVLRLGPSIDIEILWKALLLYVLVYFFALKAFAAYPEGIMVAKGLSMVVRSLAVTLMMVVLVDVCRNSNRNPTFVLSIGYTVWSCGVSASTLLYEALSKFEFGIDLASLAIVIAFVVLPSMKDFSETRVFADLADRSSVSVTDVDSKCNRIADRFNLTDREREVFAYLGKGRSRSYIAETLCLSENTVAYHSKNIYAKLGVHSKQALLDLIDGDEG